MLDTLKALVNINVGLPMVNVNSPDNTIESVWNFEDFNPMGLFDGLFICR